MNEINHKEKYRRLKNITTKRKHGCTKKACENEEHECWCKIECYELIVETMKDEVFELRIDDCLHEDDDTMIKEIDNGQSEKGKNC